MNISELIVELEKIRAEKGNLPVVYLNRDDEYTESTGAVVHKSAYYSEQTFSVSNGEFVLI